MSDEIKIFGSYRITGIAGCSKKLEPAKEEESQISPACKKTVKEKDVPILEQQSQEILALERELSQDLKHFACWIEIPFLGIDCWRPGGLKRQDNGARLAIAKKELKLYLLTHNPANLKNALNHLEAGLNNRDPAAPWQIPLYFELALQKADTLLQVSHLQALQYCEEIIAKLTNNKDFCKNQGEADHTIAGYLRRALFIKAFALEGMGKQEEAEKLFAQVAEISEEQAKAGGAILFLKDQKKDQIEYLAHVAKLRLGFINLSKGNPSKAQEYFKAVLSWERAGKAHPLVDYPAYIKFIIIGGEGDPYLDLAFAALVGSLQIAAKQEKPADWFNINPPWQTIAQYQELKKILKVSADLSNPQENKWEIFMHAFSNPKLEIGDQLKALVRNAKFKTYPDSSLGKSDPVEGRPKLDGKKVESLIPLAHLEKAVKAIAAASPDEGLTFDLSSDPLQSQLDLASSPLLPYLLDDREYWNNAIIMISVLAREYLKENQPEKALHYIERFKAHIQVQKEFDRCYRKAYAPAVYYQALLDITHAELLSQSKNKQKLEQGIALVLSSIKTLRASDKPDSFAIAKATILLGDLYQQLGYLTRKREHFKTAESLYQSIASLDDSREGINFLKGIALLKTADLFISSPGHKKKEKILEALAMLEAGIQRIEKTPFYLELGKVTRGKLLLALADKAETQAEQQPYLDEAQIHLQSVTKEHPFLYAQAQIKVMEIKIHHLKYVLEKDEAELLETEDLFYSCLNQEALLGEYSEYWDKVISAFALYAQAAIARQQLLPSQDQKEIERALLLAKESQYLRGIPSPYSQAVLDLTTAELHYQRQGQTAEFYLAGKDFAEQALKTFSYQEQEGELYDYFSPAKGILILADLNQQLANLTFEDQYYQKAADLYKTLAAVKENQAGFSHYLKGLALIKKAALFASWARKKEEEEVSSELSNLQKGVEELEIACARNNEDKTKHLYYFTLAELIHGELLLALADRTRLHYDQLVQEAKAKFRKNPPEFKSLYAWAQVKLIEIEIRSNSRVNAKTLLLQAQKIGKLSGYLQIELDFIMASLYLKLKRTASAFKFLRKVESNLASLAPINRRYFKIMIKLKTAEAFIQKDRSPENIRKKALPLLKKIEGRLDELEKITGILSLDMHQIKAELYQQLAIAYSILLEGELTYKYACRGCGEAKLSSSTYERTQRFKDIAKLIKPKEGCGCYEH